MDKHCKGCMGHHNARHPRNGPLARKYNDWCSKYGYTAKAVIGHCKLNNGKSTTTLADALERGEHKGTDNAQ